MNTNSPLFGRLFAAFGAVAMTATLLISSFSNPTATTIAGVLA
ncbi:hypothetical protein [Aurantiacibacter aquimixticola]|nr:hypothetical protein [Aurantiacibacter aquimixticola]